MLMKGQASELSPLSVVDKEPLHHLLDRVAEQLGVPVDPRCKAPLAPGQVQHFAPVRQPSPGTLGRLVHEPHQRPHGLLVDVASGGDLLIKPRR